MKRSKLLLVASLAAVAACDCAVAADGVDLGRHEYEANCVTCVFTAWMAEAAAHSPICSRRGSPT